MFNFISVFAILMLSATAMAWRMNPSKLHTMGKQSVGKAMLGTAASFAMGTGVVDMSNLLMNPTSFIARADESVFVGKYNDPKHPGCLRDVSVNGKTAIIVGSDDIESNRIWRLVAEEKVPGEMMVDFSPKGGPKDLLGVFSKTDNAIKWPDGNMWTKK
jgi:hypothetical protein